MFASCGVDTLYPQRPEGTFFVLPVSVGIYHTFLHSVLGNGIDVFSSAPISFVRFEDLFPAGLTGGVVRCSWHIFVLLSYCLLKNKAVNLYHWRLESCQLKIIYRYLRGVLRFQIGRAHV